MPYSMTPFFNWEEFYAYGTMSRSSDSWCATCNTSSVWTADAHILSSWGIKHSGTMWFCDNCKTTIYYDHEGNEIDVILIHEEEAS